MGSFAKSTSNALIAGDRAVITAPMGKTHPLGHFAEDGWGYRITNPRTPRPWINVLSNKRYGLVVSQAGSGFSWIENCQFKRINRWDQDLVADAHGKYFYIQEIQSPEEIWSATYQPTQTEAESEAITHYPGYSVFDRSVNGIESSLSIFIPEDLDAEIVILKLKNTRSVTARLRVASYIDWWLGNNGEGHREFNRLFIETTFGANHTVAWKHPNLPEGKRETEHLTFVAFHAVVGADLEAWSGDKAAFLGTPASPQKPQALITGNPGEITGRWDDPIASAWVRADLAPGEERTIIFVTGAAKTVQEAEKIANSITVHDAMKAFDDTKREWQQRLTACQVTTPDRDFDTLVNIWFPYQAETGRVDARCAYYQQGGAYGYRDQLQDSLMFLATDPAKTLHQLKLHASAMYDDGGVRHWWFPDVPVYCHSHHSDTCLWLAFGMLSYLDETNDLDCLTEQISFLSRETEQPGTEGTMVEHVKRGIARALGKRSERGIPLIGAGDWNDGLSHAGIDGKGESVWMAMFLFDVMKHWAPILHEIGDHETAKQYELEAENLRQAVEAHGWDGEWYVAGTDDTGAAFGSHKAAEGSIFLNPQTWSVLTNIGSKERQATAMQSAMSKLNKPYGALLLAPAFTKVNPYIGYITRYAPGLRENGGVYSHASTWAVMALVRVGELEKAFQLYQAMCPNKPDDTAVHYTAEPYVMPGNVDGPDSPHEGRAGWTWYTGSAAWMRRVALDELLGIRATREGLVIHPRGRKEWKQYSVVRPFRGNTYRITVIKDGSEPSMTVNGQTHVGPLCIAPVGETIEVVVRH